MHFKTEIHNTIRLLLSATFEQKYKQFNTDYFAVDYTVPCYIPWAINSAIDKLTMDNIEELSQAKGEVIIDEPFIDNLFHALLASPKLQEHCETALDSYINMYEDNAEKYELYPNAVYDKTSKTLYKSKFGEHFGTAIDIIELHPELDTTEKQDDFVMNQLVFFGNKYDEAHYVPDFVTVKAKELKPQLKHAILDHSKYIDKIVRDLDKAIAQGTSETYYNVGILDWDSDKCYKKSIDNVPDTIRYLARFGVLEDADYNFLDENAESVEQALEWVTPEKGNCELTLFTTTVKPAFYSTGDYIERPSIVNL